MPPLVDFGTDAIAMDAARQQLFLITAVYNDRRDVVTSYLGDAGEILSWQRQSTSWPPSWVLVQTAENKYFLAIEGTTNVNQALQHFWGSFGISAGGAPVAEVGPWQVVAEEMAEVLDEWLTPTSRNIELRISGHSYGGAIAQLLGNRYRGKMGPESSIQVMTFGAPRAVSSLYTGPQPQQHWRVESTGDPVPTLPPGETVPVLLDSALSWFFPEQAAVWQHRGTLVTLYERGNTTLPNPDGPIPEGATDGIPQAHYLTNYLARLNGNYQLYGGSAASYEAMVATAAILNNETAPLPTPSLPPTFERPQGVTQVIPIIPAFLTNLGVPMATAKLSFLFVGPKGESWAESYSIDVPGVKSKQALRARFPDANQAFVQGRLRFLNRQCVLQSIRISYDTPPKESLIVPYNLIGTGGSATGDDNQADVCSTAAVWNLYGQEQGQRKVWFRGLTDSAITRDGTTGLFILLPNTKKNMEVFLSAAQAFGCGIVRRVKPADTGATRKIGVVTVNGETYQGFSLVTTQEAHGWTGKLNVSFGQMNKKNLPGLNGVFEAEVASANTFWIKYATPLYAVVPGNPGYVRTVTYDPISIIDAGSSVFAWGGSRQVKSSFTRSRGARSARRLRNLA